jgi:hypothetical protein
MYGVLIGNLAYLLSGGYVATSKDLINHHEIKKESITL